MLIILDVEQNLVFKNKKTFKHSKLGFLRPVSNEISKAALDFCLWIWTKKRNP